VRENPTQIVAPRTTNRAILAATKRQNGRGQVWHCQIGSAAYLPGPDPDPAPRAKTSTGFSCVYQNAQFTFVSLLYA